LATPPPTNLVPPLTAEGGRGEGSSRKGIHPRTSPLTPSLPDPGIIAPALAGAGDVVAGPRHQPPRGRPLRRRRHVPRPRGGGEALNCWCQVVRISAHGEVNGELCAPTVVSKGCLGCNMYTETPHRSCDRPPPPWWPRSPPRAPRAASVACLQDHADPTVLGRAARHAPRWHKTALFVTFSPGP